MGIVSKKKVSEKKVNLKNYKYMDEGKTRVIVSAKNPAHAMQLLAEKLEKRIDKTQIVEINLDEEFASKKSKKDNKSNKVQ